MILICPILIVAILVHHDLFKTILVLHDSDCGHLVHSDPILTLHDPDCGDFSPSPGHYG
jgi:hypothetical protein